MKPIKEIQQMLISELYNSLERIKHTKKNIKYYNKILGDTSFILAGLLETHLKNEFDDWDNKKWIDDSLITNISTDQYKLSLWGVIIWGLEDITDQWTDPFFLKIDLVENGMDYMTYTFLFGDLDNPEVSYEFFKENSDYWDPVERNWKYIINSSREA
jgi:hypothetical protein